MSEASPEYDVVIVGAGFAGMYAIHRLRQSGLRVRCFEAGGDVGGTWFWNRYPGARCDVESIWYSYAFDEELQQEWDWSERYAAQPEILNYAQHVADRFDLRPNITFDTRIVAADWDEERLLWTLTTDDGKTATARFFITAVGCLSATQYPQIPGLDDFEGPIHHTGAWPTEGADLQGKRVAVFGTGSSGIQLIPELAREVEELTVFQRTPAYVVPARNRPLTEAELAAAKRAYPQTRRLRRHTPGGVLNPETPYSSTSAKAVPDDEREAVFEQHWQEGGTDFMRSFSDIASDLDVNVHAADFVRKQIRQTVLDPTVASRLSPTDYPIGAKRICLDTGYYDTYNRSNVRLVSLREEPVVEITASGVRTSGGDYEVDAIVMATGYDAMTGPYLRMNIRGVGGVSLADEWSEGPRTMLGLAVHGFPNLLTITGPGSPSVLTNVIASIEQHVDWIAELLDHIAEHDLSRVETTTEAQQTWSEHVQEVAHQRLFLHANSWYLGANVPGKPRVFMPYAGGLGEYTERCDEVARSGYKGFMLS